MLREEIIQAWTNLKAQLTTRFNSTLIKPFTSPLPFKVLSPAEITALKERLVKKEKLLVRLNRRRSNQLLSRSDQTSYDQTEAEVEKIKKTLTEQTQWKEGHIIDNARRLSAYYVAKEKDKTKQVQQKVDKLIAEKDQLNYKLNWLRTLVRAKELEKLLELVRSGRV